MTDELRLYPRREREVTPSRRDFSVELKPGQVLDRGTGEVKDVIGDGEIRIRRSR